MKKLNNKSKILILSILLFIFSVTYIIVNGNTYVIRCSNLEKIDNIENYNINIDDESIINCIDKKINKDALEIKIKSKSEGKTYITIENPESEFNFLFSVYVHKFGVITYNEYMGDCNGSIIIPLSIIIILIYILYLLFISYKKNVKINMYEYKNITYLGTGVFIFFSIISQTLAIFRYKGLIDTIDKILNAFSFTIVLLPIAFVVSIFIILSNISLVRKEGFNFKNVLGIFFGAFLCFSTILPELLYNLMYSVTWIDIHNQNGIGVYIYNFVETIIYISIAYIESILIGTIIMGFKAARYIPKFDKDAIIILGCKIKKDGTLTNLLKARVDRAIEFSKMQKQKTNKDILFVPSGGKGNDEVISEAKAMENYLLEQGIKKENILIENNSKNTFENIKFSNKIIKEKIKDAKIAFSTTNYHVFRAGNIANEQNIYAEGIGSKTKSYFWINAFIREFIATLYNEKKKHIIVICNIISIAILMILMTYLNNNI